MLAGIEQNSPFDSNMLSIYLISIGLPIYPNYIHVSLPIRPFESYGICFIRKIIDSIRLLIWFQSFNAFEYFKFSTPKRNETKPTANMYSQFITIQKSTKKKNDNKMIARSPLVGSDWVNARKLLNEVAVNFEMWADCWCLEFIMSMGRVWSWRCSSHSAHVFDSLSMRYIHTRLTRKLTPFDSSRVRHEYEYFVDRWRWMNWLRE